MLKYFHLFISSIVTLTVDLWTKEIKDKWTTGDNHRVSSQAECQDFCIAKADCVGISYRGYKCVTCQDEKLLRESSDYDFYRRPG